MPIGRYVVVSTDQTDKVIRIGPVLADPATYTPGPGLQLITEQAAQTGGYTHPPRPAAEVNGDLLRFRAVQALAVNSAFLAVGAPTNAQVVAQVRALTRECNALARIIVGALDDTTDT